MLRQVLEVPSAAPSAPPPPSLASRRRAGVPRARERAGGRELVLFFFRAFRSFFRVTFFGRPDRSADFAQNSYLFEISFDALCKMRTKKVNV